MCYNKKIAFENLGSKGAYTILKIPDFYNENNCGTRQDVIIF